MVNRNDDFRSNSPSKDGLARVFRDTEPIPAEFTLGERPVTAESETITLTDEFMRLVVPDATTRVVPRNEIANPNFTNGLDDWTPDYDTAHTITLEEEISELFLQGRTNRSLKVELTDTMGVGITELSQLVDIDIGDDISFEMWVRVDDITGSPEIRIVARALDSSDNILSTSANAVENAVTSDWQLLKVNGFSVPSAGRNITLSWTAPTISSDRPAITGYHLRYREQGTTVWQPNAVGRLLAASATSYQITGLHANTTYEIELRAVNSVGNGAWVSTTQLTDS